MKNSSGIFACILASLLFTTAACAKIVIEDVEYSDGDTVLAGYLAYDDAQDARDVQRPGVLIVHQWMGLTDHEKTQARRLAERGYVAFACDMYGRDNRPANRQEAAKRSGHYKANVDEMRRRVALGLEQLRSVAQVDDNQIAAIGYCFGGTAALELARSGAEVRGVVSLHGGLGTDNPSEAQHIKAKVLVLHGADDPHAPMSEVNELVKELQDAKVDYQVILYGGAVHSFTQPGAGNDPSTGSAYHKDAANRSWKHMMVFFDELFENEDRRDELAP